MARLIQSVVLVHGAGSHPSVFDGWHDCFAGVQVDAVDLHDGLDVARASMSDYCQRVLDVLRERPEPAAVCGWSMGGLVALMVSQRVRLGALVLLEPSPPGEVQGFNANVGVRPGTFDPEVAYGAFPPSIPARPESSLARAERKRGISVPTVSCPVLVASSDEFRADRGEAVAALYAAKHLHLPGFSHWDLVLRPEVPDAVAAFINSASR